jgi:hypothetical protein
VTNTEYLLIPGRIEHPALEEVHVGARRPSCTATWTRCRGRTWSAQWRSCPGDAAIAAAAGGGLRCADDGDPRGAAAGGVEVAAGATGTVEWVEREVDRFTLRVAPDRPALLVVLDNWYPAWRGARGRPDVPILRANHTFRAVPCRPGSTP